MRPLFTSRAEWRDLEPAGERAYVRSGVAWVTRAALVGLVALSGVAGATEPYWRSAPVLVVFVAGVAAGVGGAALLFRREWRAAARTFGVAVPAAGDSTSERRSSER